MKEWLRLKEAQDFCGVSKRTLQNWIKYEGLKYSKVRGTVLISVNIRQKPKGSGIWWIFISHKGKRTSKRIGRDKKTAKEFAMFSLHV